MDELEAGRYRLLERIGSGGMAEVWRALDVDTGTEVALKRLHATTRHDPAARERLAREIDAIRAVDHPLAVRVLDADVDTRDPRMVMELLPGGSLRDRLARGPLGQAEAARIGADVGSVLAAAHEAGVIHRDVTPANILFDEGGRARLVDFGVAAVPLDWGRDAVTATTDVVGTLRFIAPEVLEGGAATPAADVWGLGAVLWEAVAGRPPFAARSPAALLEARRDPAPALDADPVLASLVAAMLARDVADRPPAGVVAAGMQRIAADLEAADGAVTAVMPAPGDAGAVEAGFGAAAPVAWVAPGDSVAPDPRLAAGVPGDSAPKAVDGRAPVPPAPAPRPVSRSSSSTASRARVLAGAAVIGLAIVGLAIVGDPGPAGRPSGADASPAPATASPAPEPPAEDDGDGSNVNEPPGNGNGRGNGNGNGGNDKGNGNSGNGNGGNGNGNGNGPDKDKPKDD